MILQPYLSPVEALETRNSPSTSAWISIIRTLLAANNPASPIAGLSALYSFRSSTPSKKYRALSHGPKTAEGKLRAAGNRVTHRLYSRRMVLKTESQQDFDALLRKQIVHRPLAHAPCLSRRNKHAQRRSPPNPTDPGDPIVSHRRSLVTHRRGPLFGHIGRLQSR